MSTSSISEYQIEKNIDKEDKERIQEDNSKKNKEKSAILSPIDYKQRVIESKPLPQVDNPSADELFNRENQFYMVKKPILKSNPFVKTYALRSNPEATVSISSKKIEFTNNDIAVASALDAAIDKGWDGININSKDPVFSQKIWLEASIRNLNTKGYSPTAQDLQQLERERLERDALLIKASNEKIVEKEQDQKLSHLSQNINNLVDSIAADNKLNDQEKAVFSTQLYERINEIISKGNTVSPKAIDSAKDVVTAIDTGRNAHQNELSVNPYEGKLVSHGEAPYQHDEEKDTSYYVTLKNDDGIERTTWGVGLKETLENLAPQKGDDIVLERLGTEPVLVKADDPNTPNGEKFIEAERVIWSAQVSQPVIEASQQLELVAER